MNFGNQKEVVPASAVYCNDKIIVIDAGHGYPDGGAVGTGGTEEKDLNLKISKQIGEYFSKCGAHVIYTRYGDNAITSDLSANISEIKKSDMKKRIWIRDNSEADIFISVHMNKFHDSRYHGAQVFYNGDNDENKQLAECIRVSLKKYADKDNQRETKDCKDSLFILRNSKIPSVLVECGFLSNPAEEKLLVSESYQDKIAFAVFVGTLDFLQKNNDLSAASYGISQE